MIPSTNSDAPPGPAARRFWVETLTGIARPVFSALARGELRRTMPVETALPEHREARRASTHLEAVGRSLAGIAPWLELIGLEGEEQAAQAALRDEVLTGLANAADPSSPDFLDFVSTGQALVDAALLAQGLLRARSQVWDHLDRGTQDNLVRCLESTRRLTPPFNNWLLFAATVETFLGTVGRPWDGMRVDYAIRQHEQWYVGDGAYADGSFFHWDYYNSFVIQPMLVDVLRGVAPLTDRWAAFGPAIEARASRYAAVLERLIAPDGSYPLLGRSISYRFGAFQLLAQAAWLDLLPSELPPAQVRCALDAVLHRVLAAAGNVDADGWLRIGLCGHQPLLGEHYISTGSLYACLLGLLPLGLAPRHGFWSGADRDWTSKAAWSGQAVQADHCLIDYEFYPLRVR